MSLDVISTGEESQIKINSFYDVFDEYSDESLQVYKHLSGVSIDSKYNEILDMLRKKDAE